MRTGRVVGVRGLELPKKDKTQFTAAQKHFADEWLIDNNGTRAYKVAYPKVTKDETAAAAATRMLKNVKVDAYIKTKQAAMAAKYEITQERVLEEYAKLAFLNPKAFYNDKGGLIPIHELPDDVAVALTGIDVKEIFIGKGEKRKQIGHIKKINFSDKKGALDSVGKHLGMFVDRLEIAHSIMLAPEKITKPEDAGT